MTYIQTFYVYQLRAENQSVPFYIGKGKDGTDRHRSHLKPGSYLSHKSYKNNKILDLMSKGIKTLAEILVDELTEDEAFSLEREMIASYGVKNRGGILTNVALGGGGTSGVLWSTSRRAQQKVSVSLWAKSQCKYCPSVLHNHRIKEYHNENCVHKPGRSKEDLNRLLDARKKSRIAKDTCEFCGRQVSVSNLKQFHGENCALHTGPEKARSNARNNHEKVKVNRGVQTTCKYCGVSGTKALVNRYHQEKCTKHPDKEKALANKKKRSDYRMPAPQPILTCPYCNKVGSGTNNSSMKRFHFENCVSHPDETKRLSNVIKQSKTRTSNGCKFPQSICVHCGFKGAGSGMVRFHGDKCKKKLDPKV